MHKFFIPSNNPEDWKWLLAEPDRLWKTGCSARALAYCWYKADDFPVEVKNIFKKSNIPLFKNIKLLFAFPEYKVSLQPHTSRPSQNDIFILARGNKQLISITVEGKVSEPFGETVQEWSRDNSSGKQARLRSLLKKLQLEHENLDNIRYQFLHRTASAIIEAERFNAENALMLVHSFSLLSKGFKDFKKFAALFGIKGKVNSITGPTDINGINLYFGWVKGDKKYLKK